MFKGVAALKYYIYIHTQGYELELGTRNISITDEAYSRLASRKRPNESFTDVINRLTEKKSILELAGILTSSEARGMRMEMRKLRKESKKRVALTVKRMS